MGSFGYGVFQNDTALDIIDSYKDQLLKEMKEASEAPYNKVEKLITLIEIYAGLPNDCNPETEEITSYLEIIRNENYLEWNDPKAREAIMEEWLRKIVLRFYCEGLM